MFFNVSYGKGWGYAILVEGFLEMASLEKSRNCDGRGGVRIVDIR